MSIGNLLAAAVLCTFASFTAHAAYPDQPIKIIAPYAAGGSSDVLARALEMFSFANHLKNNKAEARQFLVKAGIVTPKGNLRKAYGG